MRRVLGGSGLQGPRGRDRAIVWRHLENRMAKRARRVIVNIFLNKIYDNEYEYELASCDACSILNLGSNGRDRKRSSDAI